MVVMDKLMISEIRIFVAQSSSKQRGRAFVSSMQRDKDVNAGAASTNEERARRRLEKRTDKREKPPPPNGTTTTAPAHLLPLWPTRWLSAAADPT